GAGGQSVNTTKSAVRITHIPTGVVVSCQDERSQLKNRNKAMRTLRARIVEAEREKQEAEIAQNRKAQVGTGERSEKIRTYNFPQNRVTDHRVGVTLHKLEQVLEGDLDEFVQALKAQRQQEVCWIVEHVLCLATHHVVADRDRLLSQVERSAVRELIERRVGREPLQYI